MTLKECSAILSPLVLAMRAEMDAPTYRAYHRVLEKVPTPLLQAAVDRAAASASPFMPKAGELLALAETCRQERIAAFPYERCAECNYTGIVRLERADPWKGKPPKYGKCKCWDRYRARLEQLGVGTQPLALSAGVEQ